MEWSDAGLVVGVRRHGETSVILEAMTREHGRHLGLVRGGRARAMQPVLQAGNGVALTWRARLDQHLGTYAVEPVAFRAAGLMASAMALHGVATLGALLHLLPERDPHPDLFDRADALAARLDEPAVAPELLVRFELALLADFGFGLDLETCAVTGETDDLAYVSPKTGRAVSRAAGAPWRDRLLPLPAFLVRESGAPDAADLADAFRLTEHFLRRELFDPRGSAMPDSRAAFVAALGRGP